MSNTISQSTGFQSNGRKVSNAAIVAAIACVLISAILVFAIDSNNNLIFTVTGFMCFAVMLLPIAVNKNYDLLSCWSLTCLSVFLGCFLRGIYIGIDYPDTVTLDFLFTLGVPTEEFYTPAVILVLSLFCCAVGYIFGPAKYKLNRRASYSSLSTKRIYVFAFITLCISLICTVAFVSLTDGFDWQNISRKRTTIASLNLDGSHRTYGFLRNIASIAILAHLLVLADAIRSSQKKKAKYLLAFSLLIVASFLPFYASSRSTIFTYLIMSMSVFYFCNKRVQWFKIISILLIAILIFQGMSVLRSSKELSLIHI